MSTPKARILWDARAPEATADVSFIIPCKNEARYIRTCLESVRRLVPAGKRYEIVLVDNESTDTSVQIARDFGVDVAISHNGRVGFGRNCGAELARAPLYIFIDADILLTEQWRDRAQERWAAWTHEAPDAVWGSWVSIRPDGGWVEKAWFAPLRFGSKTHMNSAHLIMRAATFQRLGGFAAQLETGEDYELSMRAVAAGLAIDNDEQLEVVHLGYPRGVKAFFARELWHGRGDVSSLDALLASKTALASIVGVHAIPVGMIAGLAGAASWVPLGSLLIVPALSVLLVVKTFRGSSLRAFPQKFLLGLLYIAGRGLAAYAAASRMFTHKSVHSTA